ncbi:hypothetical protein VPHK567_0085 [Vibrio phage K567]|nr:hypothetical protein MYOV011v1_p0120 [Vibrio phage 6E35.1a]
MTETKLYKGVKKKDLPVFTQATNGYKHIYKLDDARWVPEWARTYVQYRQWYDWCNIGVGFYISKEANSRLNLMRNSEYLARYKGAYVYRYTPLPNGGGWKNSIHSVRAKGAMTEHKHDEMCKAELEAEYGRIVRHKRAYVTKMNATDWDHPYGYNSQRGWKRSKKRKQWM